MLSKTYFIKICWQESYSVVMSFAKNGSFQIAITAESREIKIT